MLWYVVHSFHFWAFVVFSSGIPFSSIVHSNFFGQSVRLGMVGWSPESRSSGPSPSPPMIGNPSYGRVGQFVAFPSSPADTLVGTLWFFPLDRGWG
ncbi:hypothetical protein BDV38DRAFT_248266 [Aspergillus pseudotamarii]|uniref:Uncharacterized protein n=1 Tax=Aspergillus pseudotamarii TaxID=132259 RepID=A0A5N6ST85_ASPPS|nr:uncharacterized protein BDV38DRAFT_248266 [Aspergillus pseudotamarii]KAE8137097.1 hypothetical protein BDV38DRAFT_248266 [Aspergillus pseudotamarii]